MDTDGFVALARSSSRDEFRTKVAATFLILENPLFEDQQVGFATQVVDWVCERESLQSVYLDILQVDEYALTEVHEADGSPVGPTCHTLHPTCYYREANVDASDWNTITEAQGDPEAVYGSK